MCGFSLSAARFGVRLELPCCIRLWLSLYLLDTHLCDGLSKEKLRASLVLGRSSSVRGKPVSLCV